MVSEDSTEAGNRLPEVVKKLAREALGLAPSYVSTEPPAGPMLSYEEPALKIDRAQTDSSDALPNAANSNARADVIEIKSALFDVAQAMDLIAEIERLNGDSQVGLTDELQKLKQYVQSAIKGKRGADIPNLGDIATKVAAAKAEATSKDETPQQKVDRLWGELKQLNEKAKEHFDALGAYTTEAEKKRRKEIEEALKNEADPARIKALQEELLDIDKTVTQRVKDQAPVGSPEHKHAEELEKLIKQREKVFKEFLEAKRALGLDKKTEEEYRKKFAADTEIIRSKGDANAFATSIEQYRYDKQEAQLGAVGFPSIAAGTPIVSLSLDKADAAANKTPAITPATGSKTIAEIRLD